MNAGHVDGPEVSEEHPEGKTETDAEKEKRKVRVRPQYRRPAVGRE